MNASHRMILNTVATYMRSVIAIALTLFSSRWVLAALGQSDFGLFNLVGSIIIFITFLNSVMAGSASRHFAYSIGQGSAAEVENWFNAAVGIHLFLGVALVMVGWPVGEYIIRHVLNIPCDRLPTCLWIFRLSLLSAFVSMASVPFVAMFTAQQRIFELAIWGTLQVMLTFLLAGYLTNVASDRLLFYAVGMVSIVIFVQLMQVLRALRVFKECRLETRRLLDRKRIQEILSYASWFLFGSTGGLLRDQGSAILLNLYFGPVLNASYGIAMQVSSATNQLSAAMTGAFAPEITASEGSGNRPRMLSLSQKANKIGTLLIMLFAIPLMIEMDYVLKLWLKTPPEYTATFCRLILVMFLIDRLTTGHMVAVSAHGKIAGYQATLGTILILTLPLSWLFLVLGWSPICVGFAFVITMLACSLGRVLWVKKLLGESIKSWMSTVVVPCLGITVLSAFLSGLAHWTLSESFVRLLLVTALSVSATLLGSWYLALTAQEKEFLRIMLEKIKIRIVRPLKN